MIDRIHKERLFLWLGRAACCIPPVYLFLLLTGADTWPNGVFRVKFAAACLISLAATAVVQVLILRAGVFAGAGELRQRVEELERSEDELRLRNRELASAGDDLRKRLDENVAEREQAEEALINAKLFTDTAIDSLPGIFFLLDIKGRFFRWNENFESLAGLSFHDLLLADALKVIRDEDREHMCEKVRAAFEKGYAEAEVRIMSGEGELHHFRLTCVSLELEGVPFIVCTGMDITEHRMLEQELLQQKKLEGIGLLAGGIAHDFNNLLTPVLGYADIIRRRALPGDEFHCHASYIIDAADKAKNLVSRLLSFSRKQPLKMQNHDLNDIISSFVKVLRRTIRENIDIRLRLSPHVCQICADVVQIEQVLLNLAVNAQDAIAANGIITIETGAMVFDDEYCRSRPGARPGRQVILSFSDSGGGMDHKVMSRVFEPFYSTKPAGHGTGLGLSTVYGIVKQHDGHIELESSLGCGTIFRVSLPESFHLTTRNDQKTVREGACTGVAGTILLVEDNESVMRISKELLESGGHTVLTAETPDRALEIACKMSSNLDLLISDVVMPCMNGPELYKLITEQIPQLEVLYMSGYTDSIIEHDSRAGGTASFISKPFTPRDFLDKVSEILCQGPRSKSIPSEEMPAGIAV